MKALIVKEDGLIYAAEVPEEPEYNGEIGHSINVQKLYYGQLEVAKTNATLISDQEKAMKLLRDYHSDGNLLQRFEGIYPIPDLQWEPRTVEKFYEGKGWLWETVAILKESTPSHFNGCSPTACGCKSLADCPNNQPQITVIGQCFRFKKFSTMQEEPRSVASDRTELSSTDHIADVGKMVGKTAPSKEETKLQSEQKTVRHYRKKPVVIEAIRWTGCMRSFEELKQFCPGIVDGGAVWHPYAPSEEPNTSSWPLFIHTLEGTMAAKIGDYIIKGVNGEFYPCDPDIFKKTYEAASQFKSQLPIEQKLIPFLQDRIRDAFKAAESGMGSQFYPFDEESTESIKGMRRAYADVLVELQRSQPSPIEGENKKDNEKI